MKIYTKNGDKGNTKLLYGGSVSKDNFEPEAVGTVDELVASLGIIRAESELPTETKDVLLQIQRELFIVGAELATSKENRKKLQPGKTLVEEVMITNLEEKIDILENKNELNDFLTSLDLAGKIFIGPLNSSDSELLYQFCSKGAVFFSFSSNTNLSNDHITDDERTIVIRVRWDLDS